MRSISSKTIDAVTDLTDFASLVSEYTHLEKRGSEFWGKCPFHTDKTPSFHIIPDRKMYKCFSCGRGGSAISFYMEMEKVSFPEAVIQLAKKNGIEVIYEGNIDFIQEKPSLYDEYTELYNRLADTYKYFLHETEMGKFALNYLKSRGVTEEMSQQFKIGYAPADGKWLKGFLKSKNYSDDFLQQTGLFSKKFPDFALLHDRLMFPIFDRKGNVVGFSGRFLRGDPAAAKTGKYVNTPETDYYKKNETLYGFNFAKETIRKTKKVIICEGNLDIIAYHQAGITNAVATCGTALTENHLKLLSSFVDTVYLSFDSDEAGIAATQKQIIACRKLDLPVRVVKLEGGKDPNEILNKLGPQPLTDAINRAILDADFLLSILANRYDIGTLDGKSKASFEFFEYVKALKQNIQKEASLQQLCQTYNLKPDTVFSDFNSFNDSKVKKEFKQPVEVSKPGPVKKVKLNAEIRIMLAVVSDMNFFSTMRSQLTVDDFEDELARDMFIALEECFREGSGSYDAFLARCTDERVKDLVINSISTGEFGINSQQALEDCVALVKRNSLRKKREILQNKVRQCTGNTLEDKQNVEALLSEIMNIDFELKKNK